MNTTNDARGLGTMKRRQGVSDELDELSSELVGDALDILAEGDDIGVLLVIEDENGDVASFEFVDDAPDELIDAAHDCVVRLARAHGDKESGLGDPIRYALVYEGMVGDETGAYQDALLLEFGERGYNAYSAYSFYEGKGAGEDFRWTEPAPAGEVEPLL